MAQLREEAARILSRAQRKGIDQSLEPVKELLCAMGDPDLRFDSLQIVGTNGKSSTARYAAAILKGEGLRVGLYVSPMLETYGDQIEVDGATVGEKTFCEALVDVFHASERINALRDRAGEEPFPFTEFELITVAAIVIFARESVDVAVLEAGLGGRWDATSAARSIRSVAVTGIGLDHTRILGSTLEEITREKASVIQEGRACVLGQGSVVPDSVRDILLARARSQGVAPVLVCEAPGLLAMSAYAHATFDMTTSPTHLGESLTLSIRTAHATYDNIAAIKPAYQAQNIACALVLVEEHLRRALNETAVRDAVMGCATPGRFELVRTTPPALIDACHNPQSVEVFLDAVRSIEPHVHKRPTLLCAVLADKDVAGMVSRLAPEFPQVVVTQTKSPRALCAPELAKHFIACGTVPVRVYDSVNEAVASLENTAFVACGSITTAGEVKAYFRTH